MTDVQVQMFQDAISNAAADVVFGIVLCVIVGVLILLTFFAGLGIRAVWRCLRAWTVNRAIVKIERRCFR